MPCSATISPEVQELLEAVEDGNATVSNMTKHCYKTEFKCCPDWYTPAEGINNEGCPQFTLGACNDTKFGCCLDGVTLSRGPNYEGCGEPSCAASLYGCCKDRKTIAFGTHYAGCERSSYPCELSSFGCCPDGETAALSKNLTGCGASCLLTNSVVVLMESLSPRESIMRDVVVNSLSSVAVPMENPLPKVLATMDVLRLVLKAIWGLFFKHFLNAALMERPLLEELTKKAVHASTLDGMLCGWETTALDLEMMDVMTVDMPNTVVALMEAAKL
uniref:Uncharacterized protein n=1 Tax=Ditylenchus dipsaci TaxID=166011 RepID=A0A915E0B4_9BILA